MFDSRAPLSDEFGPFDGRVWLNAAHQGPLPASAQHAVAEALRIKVNPSHLPDAAFWDVPRRLRASLARLIDADPSQVALTNSTTYGINLIAQGLDLRDGDEVLVVAGDFPATVLPWLDRGGITIRFVDGSNGAIDPERLEAALSARTRVFASSWVFSFFGHAADLQALGEVCRRRDILFVVNASQGVGARPISVRELPIDALSSCGFKWLCGPYATGFCWLAEHVLERIDYPAPNWLLSQDGGGLNREMKYELPSEPTAARYDAFCTANFLNYMPWTASVEHLMALGTESIHAHDQMLVERFLAGLPAAYEVVSPREGPARSTLVLFSHRDKRRNPMVVDELNAAGVDVALREEKIRVAPHVYNSAGDIDAALDVLTSAGVA